MDIFELVNNEKFFNPLSSKNKRIYFDCISLLIEKSKEMPVLYESDAKNCIAIYLKNSEYELQEEWDLEGIEGEVPERSPATVMAYLRQCGWITPREIGRNGENIASVTTNCRRVIEFLKKMCERSNEGALSNHIFSMYEILKSAFSEDSARGERPYSNILKPLLDHEMELKNELLDLKDNIANIMRVVMELQDVNSVGKFLIKDELLNQFFNDYFFIKNNGLIPSQLAFIRNKLRAISRGEMFEKIVMECAAKLQIDKAEAREKVEGYFSNLEYFLAVEYEENMEHIDVRINNYYNLANTRMVLVMGSGLNLQTTMDAFLNKLKGADEEVKTQMLDQVAECMKIGSQKYISRRSYERRRRRDRDDIGIGLSVCEISKEEKERRTEALMQGTKNRFTIEGASHFFEKQLANSREIEVKGQNVTTREDAIMYAASVMYAGIDDFGYEVELKEDFAETEVAKISNMIIRKKRS